MDDKEESLSSNEFKEDNLKSKYEETKEPEEETAEENDAYEFKEDNLKSKDEEIKKPEEETEENDAYEFKEEAESETKDKSNELKEVANKQKEQMEFKENEIRDGNEEKKEESKKEEKKSENDVNLKEENQVKLGGLTSEEVKNLRIKHGWNETVEEKKSPLLSFLKKFWGATPVMLELTFIFAFALQEWATGVIIVLLLVFNAVIAFVEEKHSANSVEALKRNLQVYARVKRDGKWESLPSRELVPSDVVRVRVGDLVPADITIYSGNLDVDQSAINGESDVVHKKENDEIYAGSVIKSGEATVIVSRTGTQTFFGKTIQLVSSSAPKLHSEAVITRMVYALVTMVVIFLLVAFLVNSFVFGQSALLILPLVLILLISGFPVTLPPMFTVTMAVGSNSLTKQGILITRLNATEDAASMSVLCSDKTGTLTKNKLSIVSIATNEDFQENDVILYGCLASKEENNDSIDSAFFQSAKERNILDLLKSYKELNFVPFDPTIRRTEAKLLYENREINVMKGAVTKLFEFCEINEENKQNILKHMDENANHGQRTIAVSIKDKAEKFRLVGIVGLSDPPRDESKSVIEELKDLGVRVVMLTGDSLPIAKEIAKKINLGENILNLQGIRKTNSSTELSEISSEDLDLDHINGFAEIFPADKHFIVKEFQKRKAIVGMTGDGVNDTPALKQAEVGIAVSNATDAAKGAASVVFLDEGLAPIIKLIKVGRMIHQRIVTWIINKIVKTFQSVVLVVIAFLIWKVFIISAFEMILLMFLVDFVTISLATDNARPSRHPEDWNMKQLVSIGVLIGILTFGESLVLLYVAIEVMGLGTVEVNTIQTFGFEVLFFYGLTTIYILRERSFFWRSRPSWSLIIVGVIDSIFVILCSTFGISIVDLAPLPIKYTGLVIGWTLASNVVNDLLKVPVFFYLERYFRKRNNILLDP